LCKTDKEDLGDTSCFYCLGTSREMWIQCTDCKLWSYREFTDGRPNSVCL